jgi:hypothetical protein
MHSALDALYYGLDEKERTSSWDCLPTTLTPTNNG